MDLKITTLIENKPSINSELYYEHGLSLYIETGKIKILFDTGQSGDFIRNAELLKVDLSNLDYVLLSHGHYDHSGGFEKFANKFKEPYKLIVGKSFFAKKYKLVENETYKYNGNSFDEKFIDENNISIKYIKQDIYYISPSVMAFSNFKSSNNFELLNPKFKIKFNENYTVDDFSDEIVLAVKLDKGLVVIVGCSHVGIVNILETIMERTGMPIYGVIGGTHLIEADDLRLNRTIDFFKKNDIKVLRMSHCTGDKAIEKIKMQFKESFIYNNTGNVIEL
ncbi:MBL fold metallo-hydrolase [Clostridium hydrogenum]|uniref:MBL fold metallo-hydrolase n=1 Tax=Clostridium hydrogenum TaxID=2855764 RepID=UPI001F1E8D9B|nr:MBL fold metallo-hydrolase [Clostridium hydrogenum]